MNKSKFIFNVIGLTLTGVYYAVSLFLESKRETKISDNDIDRIAEKGCH